MKLFITFLQNVNKSRTSAGRLSLIIRPRKNNCWFPVTRPTLILPPDPTNFFSIFPTQKNASMGKKIKTITFYQSIMMVTNIFHDRHLPVDKTSIVKARGLAVVSGLTLSKNKISK
jgi:hypothetical protein